MSRPGGPASPLPGKRTLPPSFIPAGIFTLILRGISTAPAPRQVAQGFSITVPLPPQAGHGREKANGPWFWETEPLPPQVGQVLGRVPGLRTAPLAGGADGPAGHGEGHGYTGEGLVEGDGDVRLEITPLARLPAPSRPRAHAAEEVEDVAQVPEVADVAGIGIGARAGTISRTSETPRDRIPVPGRPLLRYMPPSSYCLRLSAWESTS